jgi:hypothetical protein
MNMMQAIVCCPSFTTAIEKIIAPLYLQAPAAPSAPIKP